MPPDLARYFELLSGIENSSRCLILGPDDAIVAEAPVKEMIEALAGLQSPAKTVVFDGVISQRLLDVAQEKGVQNVIASRVGAVGKIPEGVRILTRADLVAPGLAR
jgi:DNA primase